MLNPRQHLTTSVTGTLLGLDVQRASESIVSKQFSKIFLAGCELGRSLTRNRRRGHNIQTELERYISWPGQAPAYKIDELRLRQLQRDATRSRHWANASTSASFTMCCCSVGALLLDVLTERVRAWIGTQRRE